MFSTPAMAQTVGGAAAAGGPMEMVLQFAPILVLVVLFYFLLIRPQQQRQKAHVATVSAVKRNDTVVLSSGLIGKVVRVEDTELGVEIAQGVTVKVVKSMVAEVRTRGAPAAANDAKA